MQKSPSGALHTIETLNSPTAGERSSDLGSDRPGRSFESVGATRHAIAPKHDLHDQEKANFLKSVAGRIDAEAKEHAFDSLLLVAPGRAMTTLHDALSAPAEAMLVGTLGKDLIHVPDHDLREHVVTWL